MLLRNAGLRLMGVLGTTRGLGDPDLQPYGLTPEPEVLRLPRHPGDEFLVSSWWVAFCQWSAVGPLRQGLWGCGRRRNGCSAWCGAGSAVRPAVPVS